MIRLFPGRLQVKYRAAQSSDPRRRNGDSPAVAVICPATPGDFGTIVARIRELAIDENEPLTTFTITDAELVRDGPGLQPRFECLLAETAGRTGFAFFLHAVDIGGRPCT